MKPDWDRLAEEAPADVIIADVDCGKEEDVSDTSLGLNEIRDLQDM